jgi:transcription initiation factor TFIIIB Brf1 subunit/transcription initiation factor TFIIB
MKKCKICGNKEALKVFKDEYICEKCIQMVKEQTKKTKKQRMSGY